MREILFRGKRVDNGEWIEGFYAHSGEKKYILIDNDIAVGYIAMKEVNPDTIGQYTGLTDKNGTKIFEGDIIKQDTAYKQIIGCVQICKEPLSKLYGVCEKFHDGSGTALLSVDGDYEVIGNIFGNPELLRSDTE